MRKLRQILIVLILLLLTACGRVTEEEVREALHNNLIKRYGEEFEIGYRYMGRRSAGKEIWYKAEIYPSKYKGTPREYDKYYRSSGSLNIKKGIFGESIDYVGDIYRLVLINESAKFWLSVLNDLRNRGVKDILIASIDGLTGFSEAIKTVFPHTDIQRCIIHQIRYTLSFVSYKEKKEFAKDLKEIYTSPNEETGYSALEELKEKWSKKYPYAMKSWENNWSELRTFFKFSPEIRRIMYTTNVIENLNRIYRKVTKTRSSFPTDMALMKLLYLSIINLTEKWKTGYAKDWHLIKGQLAIEYEERLKGF